MTAERVVAHAKKSLCRRNFDISSYIVSAMSEIQGMRAKLIGHSSDCSEAFRG